MSSSVSILLFFKLVHDIEKEREVVEEHRHAIPKSIFLFPESLILLSNPVFGCNFPGIVSSCLTPGLDWTRLFMSLTAGAGTRCMSLLPTSPHLCFKIYF